MSSALGDNANEIVESVFMDTSGHNPNFSTAVRYVIPTACCFTARRTNQTAVTALNLLCVLLLHFQTLWADALLFVYSITDAASFNFVQKAVISLHEITEKVRIPVVLVGTKGESLDLPSRSYDCY